MSNMELVEANREKVLVWAGDGRAYFWIAKQLGINDRNTQPLQRLEILWIGLAKRARRRRQRIELRASFDDEYVLGE